MLVPPLNFLEQIYFKIRFTEVIQDIIIKRLYSVFLKSIFESAGLFKQTMCYHVKPP